MIDRYDAYLFDLDGVVTPTVLLHRRAWQETFDRVFALLGAEPYRESDYFESLDGRPRFEGVAVLLAARGIDLPEGADDDEGLRSIRGIGNLKNRAFSETLERDGIDPYPGSVRLLDHLARLGKPLAIVSSSRNAEDVLRAAGLRDRFEVVIDGVVAAGERIAGKPAPDTFLRAAELLGVAPGRAVVFEDAVSGVEAGHRGGFGLVVGVDRGTGREALEDAGADLVVGDLVELLGRAAEEDSEKLENSEKSEIPGETDEPGEPDSREPLEETAGPAPQVPRGPRHPEDPHTPFTHHTERDFGDDPWRLVVRGIDPALAGQDETIFALSNGYLGLRGNHEEGLPLGNHGTFVNGLHETWRIRHAEYAYGFAEHGQTIVNAPDAKTIRIYVDDERLNLSSANIVEVTRTLDLRAGTLERSLVWITPTGKRVLVETRRMVSFESRHMATLEMRITVLDSDADLTISSLIMNRQDLGRVDPGAPAGPVAVDPRKSEQLGERTLEAGPAFHEGGRSVMSFTVHDSRMVLGVGADHSFDAGDGEVGESLRPGDDEEAGADGAWQQRVQATADRARHVFQGRARKGRAVTLVKTITYHASTTATLDEMLDRCVHTLDRVVAEPAEARWQAQRRFLDGFWRRSDVEVDAEPGVQQAIRWNLFQVAQAAARADGRGIAAKGLTGSGYSGHYFWDSEIYVLPFLSYTTPLWARNALRSRQRMLPQARQRATMLNEDGALFPWRTITGEEASAYYAAGTAAYHINADITYALARYVFATGDFELLRSGAADIPIETARLWSSLGFWGRDSDGVDRFHIHGVTGPDEYTTVVNDNLFTNVMARFNLRIAVEVVRRFEAEVPDAWQELRDRLRIEPDEVEAWQRAADGMFIPYSEEIGVHPQDAHFLEREVWDLAATPPEQKPLLLNFHPLVIYRFQVLKQADVVLALLLASDEFSTEEKRRDFEYYDALTTGDSTLSAVVQAVIAAEVGYRDLAYRYFDHALHVDLADLHRNSSDGAHIASAGGVWMALVQGFAGMRDAGRRLSFDPRLPAHWGGIRFSLAWRGRRISVALEQRRIRFELVEGEAAVRVSVRGQVVEVEAGAPVEVELADQGPDLGSFRGLSAGILPRDGDTGAIPVIELDTMTTPIPIPTLPPTVQPHGWGATAG